VQTACHATAIIRDLARRTTLSDGLMTRMQTACRANPIILGCSRCWDSYKIRVPYHLIEALTGHAQPAEGASDVRVFNLGDYVDRHVPESVQADWGAQQTPDFQISGNFPVALLLGGKGLSKGVVAPDPLAPLAAAASSTVFDQSGQTVQGSQTIIAGAVHGPVLSGQFGGPVVVGGGEAPDFRGSQAAIYKPSGPVKQQVGDQISITGDGNVIGQGSSSQVIKTGGGAHVGGNVQTGGGDFVGRDSVVHGDQVHGDKVIGDKVGGDKIARDKYEIHLGSLPQGLRSAGPLAHLFEPSSALKLERIRLDVAAPSRAMVGIFFWLAVAVKQPDSSPLCIADLPNVISNEGEIYRSLDQQIVKYRVEITAPDFEIPTPSYVFLLEAGRDSKPRYFQLKPMRPGTLPILVSAYQIVEDEELAAQTRLSIEASLEVIE